MLHFGNYLTIAKKKKKDFQTYLFGFNQAVPVKLNPVKVESFSITKAKIFYILEHKK